MEQKDFGTTQQGQPVSLFTLGEAGGLQARISNYGGIITALLVPDRHGRLADVVLGFSSLDAYLKNASYFGALVGRVAGRLSGGRFELDGQIYQLACNEAGNHLHGGRVGLDQRVWEPHIEGEALRLRYRSPDGEEGYPGNLDIEVTYSLTTDQALQIDYVATSDQATPFNPTNHAYFQLGGEGSGTMLDHRLQIFSETVIPVDAEKTLSGRRESVAGQAGDFREPAAIGDRVENLYLNHGDLYLLEDKGGAMQLAARVLEPVRGRVMEVLTTERCLQFYTAMHLDGSLMGKSGQAYPRYAGFCLECEGYSDAPNQNSFPSTILRPGQRYRQSTQYRFSTD